jgi:hypothetical protein
MASSFRPWPGHFVVIYALVCRRRVILMGMTRRLEVAFVATAA